MASMIESIIAQGQRLATHSWEYGTFAEALLEWYNPELAVFSPAAFPSGTVPVVDNIQDVRALAYAQPLIATNSTTFIDGDGAAGDPASLTVSATLIGQTQSIYLAATARQITHLLTDVPRWPNGAISHREDYAELWADSVYMVPPALAYYALATNDISLLNESITQCLAYRDILAIPPGADDGTAAAALAAAQGLWRHIDGPVNADPGLWSTGNAWAAMGATRVLATALHSPYAALLTGEIARLRDAVIRPILDGAIAQDLLYTNPPGAPPTALLRNYLNDTSWFGDSSGTALLAATAYRLAVLSSAETGAVYVGWADAKRAAIEAAVGPEGLVSPVVNPLNWFDRTPGTESPEAQSFAILLLAAHRDYLKAMGTSNV